MEHTGLQSPPPDTTLLVRYLSGETTPQETLGIEQWERQSPAHALWIDKAHRCWKLSAGSEEPWNVDVMRSRLLGAISSLDSTTAVASVGPETRDGIMPPPGIPATRAWPSRFRSYLAYGVAASLLIIGGVWVGARPTHNSDMFVDASTYATPNGQRANVTLPDGSTVSLNVGSRLQVPADFLRGNRVLRLEGEALFSVNQKSDQPFTVIAGSSVTKVLGTRFAVRRYGSDTSATIAVQEGKVSVEKLDRAGAVRFAKPAVLSAQQQVEVSPQGVSSVSRATDARFSFERNRMILDGKELRDAIPDLNRWYDADIRLGEREIGEVGLIFELTGNSLADLQMIFEQTLSLRVVREGRVMTIYRRES